MSDEVQLYSSQNVAIDTYATQSWDNWLILIYEQWP